MPEKSWRSIPTVALFLCAFASAQSKNSSPAPLETVVDVPLPGPAVRFDYQSLDPAQGRLYIAHMNANQIVVFDVMHCLELRTHTELRLTLKQISRLWRPKETPSWRW